MITVEEIRDLKTYYVDEVYKTVRAEQETDQAYRNDTFNVPEIKEPHHVYRSGFGARMVDAPAEQIVTSNPQAFITVPGKRGKVRTDLEDKFSREANNWFHLMRRMNPNVFKEFTKSLLSRGDAFIQIAHNPSWVDDNPTYKGLPVLFIVPDSMVIYASPEEDENGVPERVIIYYTRTLADVIAKYPHMVDTLPAKVRGAKEVDWLAYIDKEVRYTEVGPVKDQKSSVPLWKEGIVANVYGCVPFVHRYSGFGMRTPDGELSKLIVSGIRGARDLLREECAIRSDIASTMHLYAHPGLNIIPNPNVEIDADDVADNIDLGPGMVNVLPAGVKVEWRDVALPSAEAFQYHRDIITRLEMMNPFIVAGFPYGTSGRQDDRAMMAAMRRFDTIIENTETAFATAVEKGFEIARTVPTLWSSMGFNEKDSEVDVSAEVKLRAENLDDKDRLATLGERLWNGGNGSIDLRTNLTQYKNYTDEEASDIMANILVDKLTLFNPDVAEVLAMVYAEESGMMQFIEKARQRQLERSRTVGITEQPTQTEMTRRQGEANPANLEMIDQALQNRGARGAPERYG